MDLWSLLSITAPGLFPDPKAFTAAFRKPIEAGDKEALARELKEVLAIFEPRLRRDSIRVSVSTSDKTGLRIQIDALLMLTPVPERLRLSTMIDLDNGRAMTRVEER